jgi:transcriptional regulator with XRE-family HTH domain
MADGQFATRFALVLKALSLTRGRCAAELGVDKSLVGRWASGAVQPSAYNLDRLTAFVAARRPGFTLLDWDHDLDTLAAKFGVVAPPAVATLPRRRIDLVPPAMVAESAATTTLRGWAYEGFWRTTRPSAELPGQFIRDHILIRRSDDGLLSYTLGVFALRFAGWAMLLQNNIFSVATDTESGSFIFSIFNGVARQRADVLDGLSLTCLRDAGGSPVAGALLLERVGQLSGDIAADTAHFDALCMQNPVAAPDTIDPAVRDHLFRDVGPAALALGGDPILLMHYAKSLARGPLFEVKVPHAN